VNVCCPVWEVVTRREPHTDVDPIDVGALIRDQGLTPKIPNDCPTLLGKVMTMCWRKDPHQRPVFTYFYSSLFGCLCLSLCVCVLFFGNHFPTY